MKDLFTELQVAAIQMHEVYEAFKDAGFSPEESFQLVKELLVSTLSPPAEK